MITVYSKRDKTPKPKKINKQDIIVKKYKKIVTFDENKVMKTEYVPIFVNMTKLVNESKKMIKTNTAEEKLAELEKIMSKRG